MSVPSISELEQAARDVVNEARRDGSLSSLTPRIVRQKLELRFELDEGSLDVAEYRKPLKNAITAAVNDEEEIEEKADSGDSLTPAPAKKRKSQTPAENSEPTKKQKTAHKPPRPAATRDNSSKKQFKSSEVVMSSDAEDADLIKSDNESSTEPKSQPSTSKPPKSSTSKRKAKPRRSQSAELSADSDSEKPKAKARKPSTSGTVKKTSASSGDSKEDEEIKRLKSFVVACGTRKQWARIFKDVSPAEQIRQLKGMLKELGMEGRLSMEKAKAIREKREFEQELEDVQSFAAATATRGSRAKAAAVEENQSSSEEEDLGAKRKTNARKSIMAFLGDQSDDSE
ncbi:unnamed protein product [Mycena citricolor]|uniref:DEK-C domain-containing protein n=1 Tax=Mycena citricolor TaxID=2018698 RepID=A0AAD2Q7A8_9AGAR|nr:unnamed protein product [Mycena citricolor]